MKLYYAPGGYWVDVATYPERVYATDQPYMSRDGEDYRSVIKNPETGIEYPIVSPSPDSDQGPSGGDPNGGPLFQSVPPWGDSDSHAIWTQDVTVQVPVPLPMVGTEAQARMLEAGYLVPAYLYGPLAESLRNPMQSAYEAAMARAPGAAITDPDDYMLGVVRSLGGPYTAVHDLAGYNIGPYLDTWLAGVSKATGMVWNPDFVDQLHRMATDIALRNQFRDRSDGWFGGVMDTESLLLLASVATAGILAPEAAAADAGSVAAEGGAVAGSDAVATDAIVASVESSEAMYAPAAAMTEADLAGGVVAADSAGVTSAIEAAGDAGAAEVGAGAEVTAADYGGAAAVGGDSVTTESVISWAKKIYSGAQTIYKLSQQAQGKPAPAPTARSSAAPAQSGNVFYVPGSEQTGGVGADYSPLVKQVGIPAAFLLVSILVRGG